ncbi:MAG TPA: glutathione S-transferase family protein [Candidatus Limnocylindrales bacterium]|nr:glutathione S-transferase family protein [Candidatus Limnocylindrales bacterium]
MSDLRIFSYLPNPRIWKATIAARLCGVDVEVRGSSPKELQSWLWDFDAHALSDTELATSADTRTGKVGFGGTLHKTNAFMEAHPFGTVPAAFSPDGKTGIFESNSIMRAVARLGEKRFPLYGRDAYEASRIDSFLDASLVFARDSQIYLLSLMSGKVSPEIHSRMRDGFKIYLGGINQALLPERDFLVGESISIADICFVAELALFFNEKARSGELLNKGLEPILHTSVDAEFPRAFAHFAGLSKHAAFAPDMEPYLKKIESHRPAEANR